MDQRPIPIFALALALARVTALALAAACGPAAAAEPLALEVKIPLGQVVGRIDHMAVDLARRRLFVAELGNDSVGVIDLDARKVVHRIARLSTPQGVGYLPSLDLLLVANAGDGSLRLYDGAQYGEAGRLDLGADADNVRIDAGVNRVLVGYGAGAIAMIDPTSRRKVVDVPLPVHPESFQHDPGTHRIYVNLPGARAIAVIDPATRKTTTWPMPAGGNFPMALRPAAQQVAVVFRSPAQLGVFAMADGAPVATTEACGDADDVFVDTRRERIYVSCGDGFLDVFDTQDFRRIAHIRTVAGARTSLFVPELDRLFVAVRAEGAEPAAIWVYRPSPAASDRKP
jgi:DNA-binding beta-propeller fold protein YncE